jgi:hypothetical protein
VFLFYCSAVLLAMGKTKEAMLQLERALVKAPRLLKKIVGLNPSVLQHQQVVDVIARHKPGRGAR